MTPFDWSSLLDLAIIIRRDVEGEAAQRCAISRAYYACYNVAVGYAASNGHAYVRRSPRGSHQQVWDWFVTEAGQREDGTFRLIGRSGSRLHQRRLNADYRSGYPRVEKEADLALLEARQLIVRVRVLASEPELPGADATITS